MELPSQNFLCYIACQVFAKGFSPGLSYSIIHYPILGFKLYQHEIGSPTADPYSVPIPSHCQSPNFLGKKRSGKARLYIYN